MARVYEINPLSDPRWEVFINGHPRSSVFHTTKWLSALESNIRLRSGCCNDLSSGRPSDQWHCILPGRELVNRQAIGFLAVFRSL